MLRISPITCPNSLAVSSVPKAALTAAMSCSSVCSAVKHPTSLETKSGSPAKSSSARAYKTCASLILPGNPAAVISSSMAYMVLSTCSSMARSTADRFSVTICWNFSVSSLMPPLKTAMTARIGVMRAMTMPSTMPRTVFSTLGLVSSATAIFFSAAPTAALIVHPSFRKIKNAGSQTHAFYRFICRRQLIVRLPFQTAPTCSPARSPEADISRCRSDTDRYLFPDT